MSENGNGKSHGRRARFAAESAGLTDAMRVFQERLEACPGFANASVVVAVVPYGDDDPFIATYGLSQLGTLAVLALASMAVADAAAAAADEESG